jgi:hypothetical protein
VVVGQTFADEVSAAIADRRFLGKWDFSGIQDCLISYNGHLGLVVAKWFDSEE